MRAIILGCYAPHALKGLIAGSDRKAAVEKMLSAVSGTLVSIEFTRGEFDTVGTIEVPDQAAATGVVMAIASSGAFTKVCLLEVLDADKVLAEAKKAAAAFQPPA